MRRKPPSGAILNPAHPLHKYTALLLSRGDTPGKVYDLSPLRQPVQATSAAGPVNAYGVSGPAWFWNVAQASLQQIVFRRYGPNRFANINVAHTMIAGFRISGALTGRETIINVGQFTDTNFSTGVALDPTADKLSCLAGAVSGGAGMTAGTNYIAGYSQTAAAARHFFQNSIITNNTTNIGSQTIGSDQPWVIGAQYGNGAEFLAPDSRMQGLIEWIWVLWIGIPDAQYRDIDMNPFNHLIVPGAKRKRARFAPISAGTTYNRSASDSVTATDVAARALIAVRPSSDSVTATDAASRAGSVWVRAASDTLTVSDATSGPKTRPVSASDAVTATDAASAAKVAGRAASDSVAASDVAARALIAVRSASDALTVTDAASRAGSIWSRAASDATSPTDAASRAGSIFGRSAADAVTPSDAAGRAGSVFNRTAADSVAAMDGTSGVTGAVVNDAVSASDVASRAGSVWTRTAADTLSVSDVAASLRITNGNAQDVVSIAEAAGRLVTFSRSAADNVAATDVATARVVHAGGGGLLLLRRRQWRRAA